ncbi:MAG: AMP-binding protein [Paracoccaceae bacterium]|nr:AMP-binding protein [Paracoccaceae bacterium]
MTGYLPQQVASETRADGRILLRSAHALGPVANTTGDWLHRWAEQTPDAVFLAERSGAGWRELDYRSALQMVQALGGWLIGQGFARTGPVLMLSGNSVDHGLLALAAQYVGMANVPVAEQYALIPGAHDRLSHIVQAVRPSLIHVDDPATCAAALDLPALAGIPVITSRPDPSRPTLTMGQALQGDAAVDVAAAHAAVTPDTLGKILFTSGSTSLPKGVLTTHRMMCVNQTQIADVLPLLRARAPRILDWLPWNHVFGGSHNFNMMLANGGALYIDDGKPTDALFPRTLENMQMQTGTLAFNVPIGFSRQLAALKADSDLRRRFFTGLDLTFYAGASLPQEVWTGFADMAREVTGDVPLMISSWGMTETAPAVLLTHERINRSGIVGVPLPGTEVCLIPEDEGRFEMRVKGPNVLKGYLDDPEKTAQAFDDQGFLITGDAVRFVDPAQPDRGLSFDGRISDDFKLTSGTWVRVASLRGQILAALDGLAADAVITGHDRDTLGVLIFPVGRPAPELVGQIAERLAPLCKAATGSATRVSRAMVMTEPASLAEGEMTAKGNLNTRRVLTRRAALVERLYAPEDPEVIRL